MSLAEVPIEVLRLMSCLERALAALSPANYLTFKQRLDRNSKRFSDVTGIGEARRIRNEIAHPWNGTTREAPAEARRVLRQSLAEILPLCPEHLLRTTRPGYPRRSPTPEISEQAMALRSRTVATAKITKECCIAVWPSRAIRFRASPHAHSPIKVKLNGCVIPGSDAIRT